MDFPYRSSKAKFNESDHAQRGVCIVVFSNVNLSLAVRSNAELAMSAFKF